jgi:glutamate--cysteine ligase
MSANYASDDKEGEVRVSQNTLPDAGSVHAHVGMICFKTGPPHHVGIELEWLLSSISHPDRHVASHVLHEVVGDLAPMPGGSRVTLEPGGQLELSSPVADALSRCWRDLERDTGRLARILGEHGLAASAVALDPTRPPRRMLRTPRYDAMQHHFDRLGDAGLTMMTSTAAVQVNLDAGADAVDVARRWSLLHSLGPALVAAFANSPVHLGRITGWKSTRQRVLATMDPTRSSAPRGRDPVTAWAEYALAAPVMMCRRPGGWVASPGFTFREWVAGVGGFAAPTEDDLAYHLTTLFPPVRPRGWLEVRYLDAQPRQWWPVPPTVLTALVQDPIAADTVREATAAGPQDWAAAARRGLTDPALRRVAVRCFEAALPALHRLGVEATLVALVTDFLERFVVRGRCPADDFLDHLSGAAERRTRSTVARS